MAYLTPTDCQECGKQFMGDAFRGLGTCPACTKLEADAKEAAHFAELDQLTLEERIRRLEEIAYRMSITPARYVPPPLIG